MKRTKKYIILLVLIFSLSCLVGCVSFPGNQLPFVSPVSRESVNDNKPSVFLDISFHFQFTDFSSKPFRGSKPISNSIGRDYFAEVVENTTGTENLFSHYTLDQAQGENMDYTIQMNMLNHSNALLTVCSSVLTGCSLYIIPGYVRDNYRLTANVLDKNGTILKTYILEDYMKTWNQLLLIFAFPFAEPKDVANDLWSNMLRTLYLQIEQDQILLAGKDKIVDSN